ncbi:hypothetical protein ACE38V_01765 [Cytobacillus sp. Hz8]|uniref:hypothetical protein n=1 Tax=Cytobacillus sp. Hz8 TaxID=3347168 RepID=UPI0035DD577D
MINSIELNDRNEDLETEGNDEQIILHSIYIGSLLFIVSFSLSLVYGYKVLTEDLPLEVKTQAIGSYELSYFVIYAIVISYIIWIIWNKRKLGKICMLLVEIPKQQRFLV